MCGITGIYAFNEIGRFFSINTHQSNEIQKHRGPDAGKLFSDYYVGLGHRRLSIIDLSAHGHQPMSDHSGRYTIVFNGEIYNFRELRQELEGKGVQFDSHSDTEVLLYLYIHEKEKCLEKLNGFFAFAVYDKAENELFLARDRYGIKPFFYYLDDDKLIFASEMRGLMAYNLELEVDYTSIFQYLQFNYIPAPKTIYKNTHKLLPGHYIRIKKKEVSIRKYYEIPYQEEGKLAYLGYEESKKRLLELLEQSVHDRMISDVPLGAFLSGGIDSSTVVALASKFTDKLNTFSVGYRDEPLFDETRYANLVAEKYKTNHTVFKLTTDDFFDHIFNLLDFYGEPFADSSAIPFYILSKKTRQKVTVSLSGDGADEIFAGYNKYKGEFKARENGFAAQMLKTALPVLNALPKTRNSYLGNKFRQMHRFAESMTHSPEERYWYLSSWQKESAARGVLLPEVMEKIDQNGYLDRKSEIIGSIKGKDFNEVLFADAKLLLTNDMLHKVDSMSMAHSLEVRVPFLDHRVVDFAFSLPASYKINGGMKKRILQDAVRELLPQELYNRPKKGFDVPLAKGYKKELRNWIENECLEEDFIREQKLFKPEYIQNLKKTIFKTNNFDQNQVWGILALQHWWRKFRS